jgi:hypothetical protein
MDKIKTAEKVITLIKDYKNQPNKELTFILDFLKDDFESTKNTVIKLTEHLDKVENTYNLILEEYQNRTKQK